MKKYIFFFLLFTFNILRSQSLYPGNLMLDVYGGFPNFGKALVTSNIVANKINSLNSLAPSGVKLEFMLDDKIGVGFDCIYNYVNVKYQNNDTIWSGDDMILNTNDIHSKMQRLRVHFRLNYHFEHDNPRLDSYFGIGLGYNSRTFYSTKNTIDNTEEFRSSIQLIPIPVSARVCLGGRFYFSQYVGLVGEVGLGGPLVSLGIALKY